MSLLLCKAAFLIKYYIVFAAVQDYLVALLILGIIHQEFYNSLPEMMTAHTSIHHHVLDVPHAATLVHELLLDEKGGGCNDLLPAGIFDDGDEVRGYARSKNFLESTGEIVGGDVAHGCELLEELQEAFGVVGREKGSKDEALLAQNYGLKSPIHYRATQNTTKTPQFTLFTI